MKRCLRKIVQIICSLLFSYSLLLAQETTADTATTFKTLNTLAKSDKESDQFQAYLGFNKLKKTRVADSLLSVIIKKYPEGLIASSRKAAAIRNENDPAKKAALLKDWENLYPQQSSPNPQLYDEGRRDVAIAYQYAGNNARALYYFQQIKSLAYKLSGCTILAIYFVRNDKWAKADQFMRELADTLSYPKDNNLLLVYETFWGKYGMILHHQKKYQKAVNCLGPVWKKSKLEAKELNKYYTLCLAANNQHQETLNVISHLIENGKAPNEVVAIAKPVYLKARGTDAGFDEYMQSLKVLLRQHIKSTLPGNLVKDTLTPWAAKDINGNTIAIQSLKGKNVFIDFWSSTCAPCLRALPALQTAVNKFSKDTSVVFLFIQEDLFHQDPNARLSGIKKYMVDKGFSFRVIADPVNDEFPTGIISGSLSVRALPSRFMIDKNGNIRFHMVGYPDDDLAIVEEVSAMIDMVN